MRNERHRLGDQRHTLGDQRRALDRTLARHGTNDDAVVRLLDIRQGGDAIEIDQHRRLRQTEIHRRHQALTTCQCLGVVAVLGEQRQGFVQGFRREVAKCGRLHVDSLCAQRSSSGRVTRLEPGQGRRVLIARSPTRKGDTD